MAANSVIFALVRVICLDIVDFLVPSGDDRICSLWGGKLGQILACWPCRWLDTLTVGMLHLACLERGVGLLLGIGSDRVTPGESTDLVHASLLVGFLEPLLLRDAALRQQCRVDWTSCTCATCTLSC